MAGKTIRVLLIEDNPDDAQLIKFGLIKASTDFAVECVGRLSEAIERLRTQRFEAVVADLALPDSRGLETVVRIREQVSNVALVVLTCLADDDLALASLDQGAQDYLIKDRITPESLDRAIRYAIQRQRNAVMRRLLAKLRASEQLLEKKNRRLATLYKTAHHAVDNVSHEFRTPLTVITEYVSLLRDGVVGHVDDEQCRLLDIIGDRADDLNNMVDDMLDVSKLDAGLLSVYRDSCDVSAIIERLRPSLDRKAAVRKTQLTIDIDDDLAEVYCDAEKVGRVIVNLAVNAIKFCGSPGMVRIWARHDPDLAQVVIGITDNGQGIPPQQLSAIFRRFKQLQAEPLSSTKGFGLGLSIAKELVDLNLGQLEVQSSLQAGSTFSFTVPVAEPDKVMLRYLEWLARQRHAPRSVALLTAAIDASVTATLANETHAFLNYVLRQNDLLFRVDAHCWRLILPGVRKEVDQFIARLAHLRLETNRNRPQGPLPEIDLQVEAACALGAAREQFQGRMPPLFRYQFAETH